MKNLNKDNYETDSSERGHFCKYKSEQENSEQDKLTKDNIGEE